MEHAVVDPQNLGLEVSPGLQDDFSPERWTRDDIQPGPIQSALRAKLLSGGEDGIILDGLKIAISTDSASIRSKSDFAKNEKGEWVRRADDYVKDESGHMVRRLTEDRVELTPFEIEQLEAAFGQLPHDV